MTNLHSYKKRWYLFRLGQFVKVSSAYLKKKISRKKTIQKNDFLERARRFAEKRHSDPLS